MKKYPETPEHKKRVLDANALSDKNLKPNPVIREGTYTHATARNVVGGTGHLRSETSITGAPVATPALPRVVRQGDLSPSEGYNDAYGIEADKPRKIVK